MTSHCLIIPSPFYFFMRAYQRNLLYSILSRFSFCFLNYLWCLALTKAIIHAIFFLAFLHIWFIKHSIPILLSKFILICAYLRKLTICFQFFADSVFFRQHYSFSIIILLCFFILVILKNGYFSILLPIFINLLYFFLIIFIIICSLW